VTRYERLELNVGDQIWIRDGRQVRRGVLTDKRTVLEGEPDAFIMFSANSENYLGQPEYLRQVHPSDAYKFPEERDRLIHDLEEEVELTKYTIEELKGEYNDCQGNESEGTGR
jgi:hypothetical protein